MTTIARLLIGSGVVLILMGVLVWALGSFLPLGKLPGDLRFGNDHVRVFIPIASCLILSVALTVILNLIIRLFGR